ncbi:unnamed protein product [Dibothriocephalus latus]|uniref:Uncharacterized protein n=1 Tax=Dibothriocephalus latus TaxID=60516 RepID=A0A3P6RKF9_DIBLA|nr:unnamed protein product [Dibothriocephalus latus]
MKSAATHLSNGWFMVRGCVLVRKLFVSSKILNHDMRVLNIIVVGLSITLTRMFELVYELDVDPNAFLSFDVGSA